MLSNAHRAATLAAWKTLARAVAGDGVTVNSVLPGRIGTDRLFSMAARREAAEAAAAAEVPAGRVGDAGRDGRRRGVPVLRARELHHRRRAARRRRPDKIDLMADLICPKCQSPMRSYERSGVTVDQCTGCRGVFLDRGELERLVDAEGTYYEPRPPAASPPSRERESYAERHERHESTGQPRPRQAAQEEVVPRRHLRLRLSRTLRPRGCEHVFVRKEGVGTGGGAALEARGVVARGDRERARRREVVGQRVGPRAPRPASEPPRSRSCHRHRRGSPSRAASAGRAAAAASRCRSRRSTGSARAGSPTAASAFGRTSASAATCTASRSRDCPARRRRRRESCTSLLARMHCADCEDQTTSSSSSSTTSATRRPTSRRCSSSSRAADATAAGDRRVRGRVRELPSATDARREPAGSGDARAPRSWTSRSGGINGSCSACCGASRASTAARRSEWSSSSTTADKRANVSPMTRLGEPRDAAAPRSRSATSAARTAIAGDTLAECGSYRLAAVESDGRRSSVGRAARLLTRSVAGSSPAGGTPIAPRLHSLLRPHGVAVSTRAFHASEREFDSPLGVLRRGRGAPRGAAAGALRESSMRSSIDFSSWAIVASSTGRRSSPWLSQALISLCERPSRRRSVATSSWRSARRAARRSKAERPAGSGGSSSPRGDGRAPGAPARRRSPARRRARSAARRRRRAGRSRASDGSVSSARGALEQLVVEQPVAAVARRVAGRGAARSRRRRRARAGGRSAGQEDVADARPGGPAMTRTKRPTIWRKISGVLATVA